MTGINTVEWGADFEGANPMEVGKLSGALNNPDKTDLITAKLSKQIDNLPSSIKKHIADETQKALNQATDPNIQAKLKSFQKLFEGVETTDLNGLGIKIGSLDATLKQQGDKIILESGDKSVDITDIKNTETGVYKIIEGNNGAFIKVEHGDKGFVISETNNPNGSETPDSDKKPTTAGENSPEETTAEGVEAELKTAQEAGKKADENLQAAEQKLAAAKGETAEDKPTNIVETPGPALRLPTSLATQLDGIKNLSHTQIKDSEEHTKTIQNLVVELGFGDLLGSKGVDGKYGSATIEGYAKVQEYIDQKAEELGTTRIDKNTEGNYNGLASSDSIQALLELTTKQVTQITSVEYKGEVINKQYIVEYLKGAYNQETNDLIIDSGYSGELSSEVENYAIVSQDASEWMNELNSFKKSRAPHNLFKYNIINYSNKRRDQGYEYIYKQFDSKYQDLKNGIQNNDYTIVAPTIISEEQKALTKQKNIDAATAELEAAKTAKKEADLAIKAAENKVENTKNPTETIAEEIDTEVKDKEGAMKKETTGGAIDNADSKLPEEIAVEEARAKFEKAEAELKAAEANAKAAKKTKLEDNIIKAEAELKAAQEADKKANENLKVAEENLTKAKKAAEMAAKDSEVAQNREKGSTEEREVEVIGDLTNKDIIVSRDEEKDIITTTVVDKGTEAENNQIIATEDNVKDGKLKVEVGEDGALSLKETGKDEETQTETPTPAKTGAPNKTPDTTKPESESKKIEASTATEKLEKQIAEKEGEISTKKGNLEETKRDLETLEKDLVDLNKKLEGLDETTDATNIDVIKTQIANKEGEIIKQEELIKKTTDELNTLTQEKQTLEKAKSNTQTDELAKQLLGGLVDDEKLGVVKKLLGSEMYKKIINLVEDMMKLFGIEGLFNFGKLSKEQVKKLNTVTANEVKKITKKNNESFKALNFEQGEEFKFVTGADAETAKANNDKKGIKFAKATDLMINNLYVLKTMTKKEGEMNGNDISTGLTALLSKKITVKEGNKTKEITIGEKFGIKDYKAGDLIDPKIFGQIASLTTDEITQIRGSESIDSISNRFSSVQKGVNKIFVDKNNKLSPNHEDAPDVAKSLLQTIEENTGDKQTVMKFINENKEDISTWMIDVLDQTANNLLETGELIPGLTSAIGDKDALKTYIDKNPNSINNLLITTLQNPDIDLEDGLKKIQETAQFEDDIDANTRSAEALSGIDSMDSLTSRLDTILNEYSSYTITSQDKDGNKIDEIILIKNIDEIYLKDGKINPNKSEILKDNINKGKIDALSITSLGNEIDNNKHLSFAGKYRNILIKGDDTEQLKLVQDLKDGSLEDTMDILREDDPKGVTSKDKIRSLLKGVLASRVQGTDKGIGTSTEINEQLEEIMGDDQKNTITVKNGMLDTSDIEEGLPVYKVIFGDGNTLYYSDDEIAKLKGVDEEKQKDNLDIDGHTLWMQKLGLDEKGLNQKTQLDRINNILIHYPDGNNEIRILPDSGEDKIRTFEIGYNYDETNKLVEFDLNRGEKTSYMISLDTESDEVDITNIVNKMPKLFEEFDRRRGLMETEGSTEELDATVFMEKNYEGLLTGKRTEEQIKEADELGITIKEGYTIDNF